ncbi:hypothetical protein P7K49_003226, partial [Saguinus oedipus]
PGGRARTVGTEPSSLETLLTISRDLTAMVSALQALAKELHVEEDWVSWSGKNP